MRVVVALSGGVDSSVVAARLVEAGHEVTAVYLKLSKFTESGRGCGSPTDAADAATVADMLGCELQQWDLSNSFDQAVVEPWVDGYRRGITPNPCLLCNRAIKFSSLQKMALDKGYDAVATGHYARLTRAADGTVSLYRAANRSKDQSYVLSVLTQDELRRAMFPLGDVASKDEVREEAHRRGLPVAAKPDSLDICFIPDGNTAGFLDRRIQGGAGNIVDSSGNVLGHHQGTHHYTIGQRKGLSIQTPAANGRPRYVLQIRPADNTVVVGSRQELQISQIRADNVSWTEGVIDKPWRGFAQVRSHGTPLAATFAFDGSTMTATLDQPTSAVAAGQGMVFYDGDRVVGSSRVMESVGNSVQPDPSPDNT